MTFKFDFSSVRPADLPQFVLYCLVGGMGDKEKRRMGRWMDGVSNRERLGGPVEENKTIEALKLGDHSSMDFGFRSV